MPQEEINTLLDLWAASLVEFDSALPFANYKDLYSTIDVTELGNVKWESFTMSYQGDLPETNVPSWMTDKHQVWYRDPHTVFRNMLANPDFDGEINITPFQEMDQKGARRYCDFMSGDWAWKQAVCCFLILYGVYSFDGNNFIYRI